MLLKKATERDWKPVGHEGDYLYTEAGGEHDVVGVTDAVIFVSSQKATPVVE